MVRRASMYPAATGWFRVTDTASSVLFSMFTYTSTLPRLMAAFTRR